MGSIECEGDTIDEAIEAALRALGVERDRVEIEILADATRGVLGFGGKKAKVRARVRAPLDLDQPVARVSRETRTPPGPTATRSRETTAPAEPFSVRPAARPSEPRSRPPAASKPPLAQQAPREARPATVPSGTPVPPGLEARATEVLTGILQLLGTTSQVLARPAEDAQTLVLEVTGDSSGLLIGRRGATLDALEYLVNRIVGREDTGPGRVMIDVEHYRERRREYLDGLARRLADKAKEGGRVVTLNPMSPRDRRIVHLALQADQGVATRSEGEGYYRRVLILPAARGGGARRSRDRA